MAKRSTKQQLMLSAISLLLCVSMLVGSTFAWFTDSVTSTNNIIKSGTLDVELYYQAEGQTDWTKVTSGTNIFKDGALWEPGYTEVVKLKVVNEGTLALKYKLGVNVAKETPGTLEDASTFMLSDYIKFGIVEGAQTYTRDQAIAAVKDTATPLNKAYTSEVTKLLPKDATNTDNEDIVTMVVYMPTTVGNEANYRGTQPIINLGLNLLATQLEYEEDSFDENYDKDSVYAEHFVTTADELTAAIAEGGVIALMNDLELAVNGKAISVPADKSVTLNLNGNDIIGTTNVTGASQVLFEVKGELTVEGDGTLALHDQSGAAFNNAYENVVVYVNGGVANLNGGSIVCTSDGQAMAYAADAVGGNSVINVNGATLYSSYIGIRSFPTASGKTNTINYNSGDVYGAKNGYDIWTQEGSGSSVVNIADGINYTREDQWGGMYYVNNNKAYAVTATELSAALANGGEVVLVNDIDSIEAVISKATTLDLGDNTINEAYIKTSADVTIKNGSVKNVSEPYPIVVGNGTLTIENVAIEASKSDRAIWLDGNNAVLNFNSGSILATKGENNTKTKIYGVWVSQGATANINGGTIEVDAGESDTAVGIFGNYNNTVKVTGGKISTSGKNYSYGIYTYGDVTVEGGEIVTNEKCYCYPSNGITYGNNYAIYTKGDVTISGGKITTNGYSGYLVGGGDSNQKVVISNVEFANVLTDIDKTVGGHKAPHLINGDSVNVEITGGSFKGVNATLTKDSNTATVSGGTFDVKIDSGFLAEGYTLTDNGDGTWSVTK